MFKKPPHRPGPHSTAHKSEQLEIGAIGVLSAMKVVATHQLTSFERQILLSAQSGGDLYTQTSSGAA